MDLSALRDALADDDPHARRRALEEVAAHTKEGRDAPGLVALLTAAVADEDGEVRNAASTALGWLCMKTEQTDRALLALARTLLEDPAGMVRHDAAWVVESLAQRGVVDPLVLPPLIANLSHEGSDTRAAAAFALEALAQQGLGDPAALPALRRMDAAEGTERRAVDGALAALAKLGPSKR